MIWLHLWIPIHKVALYQETKRRCSNGQGLARKESPVVQGGWFRPVWLKNQDKREIRKLNYYHHCSFREKKKISIAGLAEFKWRFLVYQNLWWRSPGSLSLEDFQWRMLCSFLGTTYTPNNTVSSQHGHASPHIPLTTLSHLSMDMLLREFLSKSPCFM